MLVSLCATWHKCLIFCVFENSFQKYSHLFSNNCKQWKNSQLKIMKYHLIATPTYYKFFHKHGIDRNFPIPNPPHSACKQNLLVCFKYYSTLFIKPLYFNFLKIPDDSEGKPELHLCYSPPDGAVQLWRIPSALLPQTKSPTIHISGVHHTWYRHDT